jgi:mRNA-degrading endonuclease YafQ of YafQ-DinJ toxin-antitoxin module
MTSRFRVLTTPSFERDFRRTSKGNQVLANALEELVATLAEDPHNRSGRHPIKKLAGLRPGEGQWRIR